MKKIITLLILLTSILSCTKNKPNSAKDNESFFLISHAGAGDPFWNIVFNGAKQAALDIDLTIKIIAPETPNDIARQVELLNAAIASKPQGIALSITDDQAFSKSLKEAKEQGIAVIAFNSRPSVHAMANNPYLAFIGMDDYLAGQNLAHKLLSSNKIHKRIMIAIHQAGHIGLEQRALGISEVLAPLGITIDKLDISSDATQAQSLIQGYLSKNKDCSTVFFAGAFGIHAAARNIAQKFPDLMLAGFDLTPLTIELIKNHQVTYSVDQQPFMQGYMSVLQLSLNARYQLMPASINTGVSLIGSQEAEGLAALVQAGVR